MKAGSVVLYMGDVQADCLARRGVVREVFEERATRVIVRWDEGHWSFALKRNLAVLP